MFFLGPLHILKPSTLDQINITEAYLYLCYEIAYLLNVTKYVAACLLFKGCVRYIFASLFFTCKREHL